MKLHDTRGAFVTIEFETEDVAEFASRWPCFYGPERACFTFQRSNGDLVDIEPSDFDGGEALAMSEDAWTYYVEHSEPEPPDTFRAWLTQTLDADQIAELAEHGADCGWPGLTYTSECVELYDTYADEIREALNEDTESFGFASPDGFVASFRRSDMLWDDDQRKNLLVWFMAERIAREISDAREEARS